MIDTVGVDFLNPADNGIEYVERLKRVQALAAGGLEEVGQQLAIDILGDETGNWLTADGDGLGVVVLNDHWALTQLLQGPGVTAGDTVGGIGLRKEDLRGARQFGANLCDFIDLTFDAAAEQGLDSVFAAKHAARLKREAVYGSL